MAKRQTKSIPISDKTTSGTPRTANQQRKNSSDASKPNSNTSPKPDNLQDSGLEDLIFVSWEDLDNYPDNPLNWKRHPQRQLRALEAEIKANSWAGALLFNKVTGRLVDGHGRKQLAQARHHTRVPVLIGSFTEEQEKRLLASFDPIGAMYITDQQALSSLIAETSKELANFEKTQREQLAKLNAELEAHVKAIEDGETPATPLPAPKRTRASDRRKKELTQVSNYDDDPSSADEDDSTGVPEEVGSIIFPGGLYDIPNLHIDVNDPRYYVQPDNIPDRIFDRTASSVTPTSLFCHSARPFPDSRTGGFLSFFTEDWRFETVYKKPQQYATQLLEEDWSGVVIPDFSTWSDWPFAMRLWSLYKSRWCGRLWQELEIPIIPVIKSIIYADPKIKNKPDAALDTLVRKTPVLAVQCRTYKEGDDPDAWKTFANMVSLAAEKIEPQIILIYGGDEHQKRFRGYLHKSSNLTYIYLGSFSGERRKLLKSKQSK